MSRILQNRWLLVLVAILLVANLVLLGYYYTRSRSGGEHRSGSDWFYREMGLSKDQEALFRASKDSFMRDMRPLWSASRKAKDSLFSRLGDASLDDSTAQSIIARIADLSRRSDERMFLHFRELRKSCTPAQQAAFDTLVPKLMSRSRGSRSSSERGR